MQKGLLGSKGQICTLSQNGYGARVPARRGLALLGVRFRACLCACVRDCWRLEAQSAHLVAVLVDVCIWLLPQIAGSIHPPVTTGHGDEVVLNSLCPAEHVDSPP